MKIIFLFLALLPVISFGQNKAESKKQSLQADSYVKSVTNLTIEGAFALAKTATESVAVLNKKVTIAILDASGTVILLVKGENVGPHNTEASRKKAYTAFSTKTPSFDLMEKAASDSTAKNLNTISELLLLGGGVPIWKNGELIGSIGISGAGGSLEDHNLAKKAVEELGFTISK